jgi:hypothetical protein
MPTKQMLFSTDGDSTFCWIYGGFTPFDSGNTQGSELPVGIFLDAYSVFELK